MNKAEREIEQVKNVHAAIQETVRMFVEREREACRAIVSKYRGDMPPGNDPEQIVVKLILEQIDARKE